MNQKRKRPNYTTEFKEDAINMVLEHVYSCNEVARRLGIATSNVTRWVRQHSREQHEIKESGVSAQALQTEICRLKKEINGLRWSVTY